jgi:hypothetical protein
MFMFSRMYLQRVGYCFANSLSSLTGKLYFAAYYHMNHCTTILFYTAHFAWMYRGLNPMPDH